MIWGAEWAWGGEWGTRNQVDSYRPYLGLEGHVHAGVGPCHKETRSEAHEVPCPLSDVL